jgi:hypothetical protein
MQWGMRYGYAQDAWSQWKSYQIGSLLPNVNLPLIDEKNQQKQEIGRRQSGGRAWRTCPDRYAIALFT